MNTTHITYQTLQAGQALALPGRRPLSLVLVEGEVLAQAPAQWLGGELVLLPPKRVAAPLALDFEAGTAFTATARAKVAIEQPVRVGGWLASLFMRPQTA